MDIKVQIKALPGFQDKAKIGKISVKTGDEVKIDDVLLSIEGKKSNLELKSEYDGIIAEVLINEDDEVAKGTDAFIIRCDKIDVREKIKDRKNENIHAQLLILGGGPGGYVAAIRAAQKGLDCILIEKDNLGGTCLNRGCIPTKSMVYATNLMNKIKEANIFGIDTCDAEFNMSKIIDRKNSVVSALVSGLDDSMKKNGIKVIRGHGKVNDEKSIIVEAKDSDIVITFDNLILAPGSRVAFPEFDGAKPDSNLTSNELLELDEIPESMIILGGRVIAMEFAFIYSKLGTKVSVIQRSNTIFPNLDSDVSEEIRKSAISNGINLYEGTKVNYIKDTTDGKKLIEFEHQGEVKLLVADKLAVATGRVPNTDGLELDKLGVEISDKGAIKVDEHMKTRIDDIYAIGDATDIYNLAHVASKQGLIAVENILGNDVIMNYDAIPEAIFTKPEVGVVGKSEKNLKEDGVEYILGKFPYLNNGKALLQNESEGFIKVIARKSDKRIVGAALVGHNASDLLSTMTNLVAMHVTIDEAKDVIYAHPTIAETLWEAITDVNGESIHK